MKSTRTLMVAAYLVAAMLVVVPVSEVVLASLPLRPASVTWRFAMGGNFSRALMTPLFGLLLASAVAYADTQRRALRWLSVLSGALGGLVLVVAWRFLLDSATMRAGATPDARDPLTITAVPVLAKLLFSAVVAGFLTAADWRLSTAPPGAPIPPRV